MLLQLKNIKKYYNDNLILNDISLSVLKNENIGIIGNNGCGKTTLLKIISENENYDEGSIYKQKNISIGYQKQIETNLDISLLNYCVSSYKEIFEIEKQIEKLNYQISIDYENELLYKKLEQLNLLFEEKKGYEVWSRIKGILFGLGFKEDEFKRKISTLSGGELTRLSLAKLLSKNYDLILLDEPTNHLELNAISWLINHLKQYKGSILFVTHDRYFLDSLSTKIIEISNAKLTEFFGNYENYKIKKEQLLSQQQVEYDNYSKKIKEQNKILLEFQSRSATNSKFAARAKDRQKKIEKQKVVEKPIIQENNLKISFDTKIRSAKDVLIIENLSKKFEKEILKNINFHIFRGDKIGIIGGNGSGKSTLLKCIIKEIEYKGNIIYGKNLKIAYYDQNHKNLNEENDLIQEINENFPKYSHSQIRNMLATFSFKGDDVFKKIKNLSGGEKARLSIFKLMLEENNLIILDEPTNHLDIASSEILEKALLEYDGTIIFVSHDKYLIQSLATKTMILKDGILEKFDGDFNQITNKKDKNIKKKKGINKPINKKKNNFSQDELEKNIYDIETELENISMEINEENVYNNIHILNQLVKKQSILNEKLEQLYEQWERSE